MENTQIFLLEILENTQFCLAEILENTQIWLAALTYNEDRFAFLLELIRLDVKFETYTA